MSEKVTISPLSHEYPAVAGALEYIPGYTLVEQQGAAASDPVPEAEPETPEAEYVDPMEVAPELQERFASTVTYIRERGDALDHTKGLRQRTIGFKSAAALAAIEPPLMIGGGFHWGIIAGAMLTTVPMMTHAFIRMPNAQARANRAMDQWLQFELGERFDIFRISGDKDHAPGMAMRYYGPRYDAVEEESEFTGKPELVDDGGATPLEHIQRMAQLAKDNDIDHFMVGQAVAEQVLGKKTDFGILTTPTLLRMKGIKLDKGNLERDRMAMQTPDYWLNLTEKKQQEKTHQYVEGVLEMVREVAPGHQLVELHDAYSPYLEDQADGPDTKDPMWIMRTQKMVAAVQTDIARNYSETATSTPSKNEMINGGDPRRQKRYMHAALEGDELTWTFNGQLMESKNLAELLNFDPEILAAIEADPNTEDEAVWGYLRAHPEESATMLSSLLIKRLKAEEAKTAIPYQLEVDETPPQDVTKRDPVTPTTDILLSNGTWSRADNWFGGKAMRKRTYRRAALGAAATALTFAASTGASGGLNELNNRAEWDAYEALTADGSAAHTQEELHDFAAKQNLAALTWGSWEEFLTTSERIIQNAKPPVPGGITLDIGQQIGGKSSMEGVVDNIEGAPTISTDWSIKANGLSAEGYWTTEVADQADLSEDGIRWIPRHEMATTNYELMPTAMPNPDAPNLEVSRPLTQNDLVPGTNFFKVPVRESTLPVAAVVGGKQTAVARMRDGTYAFTVPADIKSIEGQTVTYWLAENDQAANAPHATRIVSAKVDGQSYTDGNAVREVWAEVIPGFEEMDSETQAMSVRSYVSKNFQYRLKPFDKNFDRNAENLPDYTRRTIENAKAFCTSANGISALATLGQEDIAINMAGGYLITDPQATSLGSNRGHAWQVDSYGIRRDDTPSKGILPEDAAYLNGKAGDTYSPAGASKPDELPLEPIGWGALGLTGLGLVLMNRERINSARRDIQFRRAIKKHERLLNTDPALLHQVTSVTEAMQWDPAQDVRAALERAEQFVGKASPSSALYQTIPNDVLVDKVLSLAPDKDEKTSPAMDVIAEAAARPENADIKPRLTALTGLLKAARFIKRNPARTPKQTILSATIK